jgi:hypothetical protein
MASHPTAIIFTAYRLLMASHPTAIIFKISLADCMTAWMAHCMTAWMSDARCRLLQSPVAQSLLLRRFVAALEALLTHSQHNTPEKRQSDTKQRSLESACRRMQ